MSLNQIILHGNLGHDPSLKTLDNGTDVVEFSLATTYRKKSGEEWVNETDWHRCILFGKRAKVVKDNVLKGHQLCVVGTQRNRKWEDKDGNKRTTPEVIVSDFSFVGSKQSDSGVARDAQSQASAAPTSSVKNHAPTFDDTEEIPF